jgi:hypothetical protein
MFSISTVASSTRMPTASARPPSVIDIDGRAERAHAEQRDDDRERDADRDDDRAAQASQEQQDHGRREDGGDEALDDEAVDGARDERGLIGEELDVEALGRGGANGGHERLHSRGHLGGRSAAGLHDAEHDGALAVAPRDVGLHRKAVVHVRDVTDVDHPAVAGADGDVVERGNGLRAAVQADAVLAIADLRGAGGEREVLRGDGEVHVRGRDAVRTERAEIEIDGDLPLLSAGGERKARALDDAEHRAHALVHVVVDLRFAERVARERELEDRYARGRVAQDDRGDGARRHAPDDGLRGGGHLRHRGGDVGARMQEEADDGHAVEALALESLDVADVAGQRVLAELRDLLLHLLRRQTAVRPDDADDRDVDLGKDVGRRLPHDVDAREDEQERHHDERVRAAKGEANDPHCAVISELACLRPLRVDWSSAARS